MLRSRVKLAAAVLSAAAVVVVVGKSGSAAGGTALPRVAAVRQGPVVDGNLSDPAWKKALVLKLDGYCDKGRRDRGERPGDATEARAVTDGENLYVSFRCAESHPGGPWVYEDERLKRRGNAHVMGGDYVALALDMGRWGFYNYYMFFINPKGELYKCFTWPHRYDLILRDIALPAAAAAAGIDRAKKCWTAELKVPLEDLLRHPADGFPSVVGLDLRRVQWGKDRGKGKFKIYWTGMALVEGKAVNDQYDHMAAWKPLFEAYPDYRYAYACGRGWVQLTFPESFGHVKLEVGKIDNKLISGQGKRLTGLIGTRTTSWHRAKEMRAKVIKLFDAPRMEYWDDLRPTQRPKDRPAIVSTPPVQKPGVVARFTEKPSLKRARKETRISFKVSRPTDVIVAVIDSEGKTVRHLAAGVLGGNPPEPFRRNSLAQTITWDHKDDFGERAGAGRYRVKVCLGLKPAFHYAIPLDAKNYWYRDPTPTEKGLDIENLPNPKLGRTLGHFSRGTMNYLGIDRDREELYVQTRYVYDGKTGKRLRELKLQGPRTFRLTKGTGNGEIFVRGREGLLYIGGPNEVWRFDRDGRPVPFEEIGRHFIPELWGAHSNPHRGLCVGLDGDIYKVHHYIPHTCMSNQVTRIGPDGRIKAYGFIEIDALVAGLKVDRDGNIYLGCTAQPPEALPPADLAAKMPERPRRRFKNVYGSIVKFGPEGGTIRPDAGGNLVCPDYRSRLKPFAAEGAKWIHPGLSPMLSRVSDDNGGPGCSCRNGRFDLDDFGRLFIPDAVYGRIEVTDSNANTILFFGRRGEPDESGLELGWGTQLAVSDRACYVADYLRYRVTRLKLNYAAEAEVEVQVR